jgi:predicted RecB family nuclease
MLSATDIANFLSCHHLSTLERAEARGEIQKPFFRDPGVELFRELGIRHEAQYLQHLSATPGFQIARIPTNISWIDAVNRTAEAIQSGMHVVYQATFQDGPWGGRADFLIRVERPDSRGAFSYEVVETKLARSAKVRAILQLCFYSELLSKIQGAPPEWMHVVLGGDNKPEKFLVSHYSAFFRKIKRNFDEASTSPGNTYPEPVELCDVCDWFPLCDKRRRNDDHLSLVAGITKLQRKELDSRDINSVARLASLTLPPVPKFQRIGDAALLRVREQAHVQVRGRTEGGMVHDLIEPIEEQRGFAALPLPSPGDVFLDFEAVPYAFDTGLEYLIGMAFVPEPPSTEPRYEPIWSFEPNAEKKAFEQFIATVMNRWKRYPDLHIYHYAPYEQSAVKRLAGRHGTCTEEVDRLLRAGIFVDLYRIVRQALRASVESYSIKQVETLYAFNRSIPPRDSVAALQTFEVVLTLGSGEEATKEVLETIEAYNRDDCFSALRLRDWLEDQRRDFESAGGQALPRPATKSGELAENLAGKLDSAKRIMAQLLDAMPSDRNGWNDEQYGRWLLAQMMEWHRREEKSSWWEYFRLCERSDSELQEENASLGGLTYLGVAGQIKKSLIHRYSFPPQDHTLDRALEVHDPQTKKSAGEVVAIDDQRLTIDLKRGASSAVPHPMALIPNDIVNSDVLRESLMRLGSWVTANGIDGEGEYRAQRDLLLRRPPRSLTSELGPVIDNNRQLTQAVKDLIFRLSQEPSVLPVQGPPGSGKTFTAARMIVELVRRGCRVGITAVSHKVISNLLDHVCAVADQTAVQLRAVQKSDGADKCSHPAVKHLEDNKAVFEVFDELEEGEGLVAGGTAWLWARIEMADTVDVLFIDEAGQMSLANVLAVAQAAKSLVLLGDPQQLDQPRKGVHPPGADGSAFDHLLQGRATVDPTQGLFLAETHRLHPDICAFTSELFYEGRLKPRPENQRQRVNSTGPIGGTGIRFMPVVHSGNTIESQEEIERISELIGDLLSKGSSWTNKNGKTSDLSLEDILIVAPYNAQVSALRRKLSPRAKVGTVDKFQGQEAPIIFYSMTTSSPEDAPRGMEFLYSLNRLNVAISRARCVAALVASPDLFQVECKTPRQIELANAFCRYFEMAHVI